MLTQSVILNTALLIFAHLLVGLLYVICDPVSQSTNIRVSVRKAREIGLTVLWIYGGVSIVVQILCS